MRGGVQAAFDEGVIKFEALHLARALEPSRFEEQAASVRKWRRVLVGLGAIGQDPGRYGGAGFGNVSVRLGPANAPPGARAMLITGTQTGGLADVSLDDLTLVERYDLGRNRVTSRGLREPSSETMTHGALYDLSPSIRWVFHGHCPALWRAARALGLPWTDASIAYGTPAMAHAMKQLYSEGAVSIDGLVAMGGHEDGVVAFGHRPEDVALALTRAMLRAGN